MPHGNRGISVKLLDIVLLVGIGLTIGFMINVALIEEFHDVDERLLCLMGILCIRNHRKNEPTIQ